MAAKNFTVEENEQLIDEVSLQENPPSATPSILQESVIPGIYQQQSHHKMISKYPVTSPQMNQVLPE
ncbi:hypothetical protein CEXT_180401 [Caerostris extrusa]|uniref:Uncharacterized protein n=1 Tax=Caerostris extrusa TaxID=172846 RepID=A0AAV4NR10_CAEEX|nr:hypothetical protein CEXT_180401 [Caerostris extrusa]